MINMENNPEYFQFTGLINITFYSQSLRRRKQLIGTHFGTNLRVFIVSNHPNMCLL